MPPDGYRRDAAKTDTKQNVFDVDEREIIWGKEAVMRIFFLIALSVASLGTQALTVVPSRHLVCESTLELCWIKNANMSRAASLI